MTAGSIKLMVVGLVMLKAGCPVQKVARRREMCCARHRARGEDRRRGRPVPHQNYRKLHGRLVQRPCRCPVQQAGSIARDVIQAGSILEQVE